MLYSVALKSVRAASILLYSRMSEARYRKGIIEVPYRLLIAELIVCDRR